MYPSPVAFALAGGTLSQLTGGRFIMGIGSGGPYRPRTRRFLGMSRISTLALMRDYLTTIKCLVRGEEVHYQGEVVSLEGLRLAIDPAPNTPVYLGSLGPAMLRLAAELADGVCLNWCDPEQIAWSRDRIAEGAATAGRDPTEVQLVENIRVCIDDDEDLARHAFAKSTMGYALGQRVPTERERQLGYRGHFERMGFTEELAYLDQLRHECASADEVAEAFSARVLRKVGYYGKAEGAAQAFAQLSQGLGTALVRVVTARLGVDSVLPTMKACLPELVG